MEDYAGLIRGISRDYGLSISEVEQRVESRRVRFAGCLTRSGAARALALQSRLEYVLGIRHIVGLELADAVGAALAERACGHLATLGYWPHPHEHTAQIASQYLRAVDAIAHAGLDASISIKLDRLAFDRNAVLELFRHAKSRHVAVHFDAENVASADRVLSLVEDGLDSGAAVSTTLVSRWERSRRDAERLIQLRVPFRIVKGQGKDPARPDIDPCGSFLELAAQVAGRAAHVGVATHDRRVAERALTVLVAAQTSCSLEQLRFLPRLDSLAGRREIPIRVYVPYGRPGLPYTLAQVARRPAILWWVLRDLTGAIRQRPMRAQCAAESEGRA